MRCLRFLTVPKCGNAMGRTNGTFQYQLLQGAQRDSQTGYIVSSGVPAEAWLDGMECQIDKGFPAVIRRGTDGQDHGYNYDVFVSKYCKVEFVVGMKVKVTDENGQEDVFTVQGVDSLNRRYTEIWG